MMNLITTKESEKILQILNFACKSESGHRPVGLASIYNWSINESKLSPTLHAYMK